MLDKVKNLDSLKPDPNDPGKNQKAIDYVIALELQKTIAVWDEYVQYFDAVEDVTGVKKKPVKREEMSKFKPDDEFFPSQAMEGLENMRGVLIFRIQNM